MTAAYRDIEIPAGANVEFVVDVVGGPADLTGHIGSMQFRSLRNDPDPLAEVPADAIVVNPATRQVAVRIPGSETAGYAWNRAVYDLLLTGPTGAWLLVEGRAINYPIVTREV